jgi:hypothetical protein
MAAAMIANERQKAPHVIAVGAQGMRTCAPFMRERREPRLN